MFLAVLALCTAGSALAADEDELLLPDQAFPVSAVPKPGGVRLNWDIADGYYLYRSRFRFRATDEGVTLGDADFPEGHIKEDEFFGRMEIYRGPISVRLPVQAPDGVSNVHLEVTSQGCADVGVCYPPHTQSLAIALSGGAAPSMDNTGTAPPTSTSSPGSALSALQALVGGLGGDREPEFLQPDEAFRFSAEAADSRTVVARWEIADGYYLYRDKFKFTLLGVTGPTLGAPVFPPGDVKSDPTFGRVEVYHRGLEVRLPLQGPASTGKLDLQVTYQGCAEAGICYPPQVHLANLTLPAAGAAPPVAASALPATEEEPVSEQDRLAAKLASESALVTALWFFGFGLLLAFTPCVFPMIPILSGIIVGQGSGITTRRAFLLSVIYVLAMSLTYTAAGVLAGLFGENLQAALQNPWVLTSFAGVFVLLSLSMFGFYELQVPAALQSRLTEFSNRQRGGTVLGVAIMGLLSALIVGPCVAPPLAGALIYIGQTGDAVLGGLALFSLSLGMGAPLVVMGTLEGKYLPRAGGWMNAVKAVFGILLLGVALYLLDRVLPGSVTMLLWATLFIVSAIYMGGLEPLGKDASGFRRLWKGLGLVLLVYGILLMVGAARGHHDLLAPLGGMSGGGGVGDDTVKAEHALPFRPVKGLAGLEAELAAAKAQGRPVMLDFYADWCVSCKELEKFTFSDPAVQATLAGAVLLQADVTPNDEQDKALLKHFDLFGPPALLFFDRQGRERRGYRLVGFLNAEEFRAHAEKGLR